MQKPEWHYEKGNRKIKLMKKDTLHERIINELKSMEGQVGFYYKNLETGESFSYHASESFPAASIVKLPLAAAILLMESEGTTSFQEMISIREEEKMPACGVIKHMPGTVSLSIETLMKFMIVVSDTTAANGLFQHYGADKIKEAFQQLGLSGTQFNRAYFDQELEDQGINNYFVPEEIGQLLEKMYQGTLVSKEASMRLNNLLRQQQINHKMGGALPSDFPISHKTGEEDDRTHDVGIVWTKEPFVVCFASYQTSIYQFEDFIRRTTRDLALEISPELSYHQEETSLELTF